MQESYLHFTITTEYSGMTIETYLLQNAGLTQRQIRTLKYRLQGIQVNEQRQRIHYRLAEGDILSIQIMDTASASTHLVPVKADIQILYEDTDLIIVSKPAGLVVHPSGAHYADTLANHLAFYFEQKQEMVTLSSIGRLDKDTSGVVLFAKHSIAAAKLSAQREQGILRKSYLAMVEGRTKAAGSCIDLPLRKIPDNPYKMEVHPDGYSAVTHFQRIGTTNKVSLIKVQLETGRMHQIRVHLSASGHPLLGDTLYHPTPEHPIFSRAALHAWELSLQQPFTGEKLTVSAPLPNDFKQYLQTYFSDTTLDLGENL